jgi:hypothetical protein
VWRRWIVMTWAVLELEFSSSWNQMNSAAETNRPLSLWSAKQYVKGRAARLHLRYLPLKLDARLLYNLHLVQHIPSIRALPSTRRVHNFHTLHTLQTFQLSLCVLDTLARFPIQAWLIWEDQAWLIWKTCNIRSLHAIHRPPASPTFTALQRRDFHSFKLLAGFRWASPRMKAARLGGPRSKL